MAFDHDGFFTVLGKIVKAIDVYDGYIDAIETHKDDIYTVLAAEGLQDLYVPYPSLTDGFKDTVTGWIGGLIQQSQALMLDRDYVVEQLGLLDVSIPGLLDKLFDYMIANSETIETSVVSIGGSDADKKAVPAEIAAQYGGYSGPRLFCCRKLDGVNAPGNGVSANIRYATATLGGVESQLARSTTVRAVIVQNQSLESAVAQLYSDAQETGGYVWQDEEPGIGPSLLNADGNNLVGSNYDFSIWVGDNPTGWTLSGGSAGTDWEDGSGSGIGPFKINTVNVKARKQVTGLQPYQMYMAAVRFDVDSAAETTGTVGIKMRNNADSIAYMSQQTAVGSAAGGQAGFEDAFGFFFLDDGDDPNDVYVELHYTAEADAANFVNIHKIVVTPVTYYNGLGWAWWAPKAGTASGIKDLIALGTELTMSVSNNDNGVFQRFFRKAFNYQLPADDSPSISDSLAS